MTKVVEFTAFGPGKIILLGEHGVVYGHPALAAPISRGVRARGLPSKSLSLEMPAGLILLLYSTIMVNGKSFI